MVKGLYTTEFGQHHMSRPSDDRPDIDQRKAVFPIQTNYTRSASNSRQHRQRGERSPVSPRGPGEPNGAGGTAIQQPSKQSSRICKKCGQSFTGQYVRALGGAYHLDCFKCRVSYTSKSLFAIMGANFLRIVVSPWPRNSFLWRTKKKMDHIHCAKRTIFVGWI